MTKEEREAAALDARAERRALLAARRRGGHGAAVSATSSSTAAAAEITVCVNNACAKRGANDVAAALRALAIAAESDASSSKVKVVVKGARCMDACAAGCVLRVNGASGLETFDHVAADEAAIVLELATGAMAAAAAAADAG
jgi:NADH:ubiquinone oxidoreductase subunit E